jgi:hypothetical protein
MNGDSESELAIFTEALKVRPRDRDVFLERECRGDKHLRSRLEALLEAHDRVGDFLEEAPTNDSSVERN